MESGAGHDDDRRAAVIADAPTVDSDATRTSSGAADATAARDAAAPADERPPAPLQRRDPQRYQIIGEHGRGGLGRVFRAHDRELGRDIAIKELLQRGTGAELRFFREALITARLEHPGIVPVHEAGRWPDGTPFYAMKLVAGRPLKDVIDGARTPEARLALLPHVVAVADAIAYAHDRKIIHRDLKPANVIVGDFGETVVIDWGLAKDLTDEVPDDVEAGPYRSAAAGGLTAAGAVLGTPAYMAPEQLRGAADERSDIYALGGILFHVLTGASPSPHVQCHAPRDVRAIAERALADAPADRYPDARAFADDLRRFMQHRPIAARRYSVAARAALGFARHRGAALALVGALVAVIAVLSVSILRVEGETQRAHRALATAQTERDRAILATASALLEQDPTAARALLESFPGKQRGDAAILLSTIASLPTADAVVKAGSDIIVAAASADLRHVAIGLSDGSVSYASLAAPDTPTVITTHAYGATPIEISPSDSALAFVDVSLETVVAPVRGGSRQRLAALQNGPPRDLWFLGDDVLCEWLQDASIHCREVRSGAESFRSEQGVRVGSVAYARDRALFFYCGSDGFVWRIEEHRRSKLGGCAVTQSSLRISPSGETVGVVVSRELLRVYSYSDIHDVATPDGVADFAVGDLPAVVVKSSNAVTWFDISSGRTEVLPVMAGDVVLLGILSEIQRPMVACKNATVEVFAGNSPLYFRGPTTAYLVLQPALIGAAFITVAGNEVRHWSFRPRAECEQILKAPPALYHVLGSPDGATLYTEGRDGYLRIVHLGAGTTRTSNILSVPMHRDVSVGLAISNDGRYVATGGFDGAVAVFDTTDNRVRSRDTHTRPVRDLAFVPGTHELISAGADGVVASWDVDTDAVRVLYRHDGEAYRLAFGWQNRVLLSTSTDGSVGVYERDTRSFRLARGAARATIGAIVVGQRIFASSLDGHVYVWKYDELDHPATLQLAEGPSRALRHLPRRNILLSSWGGTLVASRPDGQIVDRYPLGGTRITALDVSNDERVVVAATDIGRMFLLDLDAGVAGAIHAADEHIWWVSIDPSGTGVYMTDLDGRLARCSLSQFALYPVLGYTQ